MKSNRMKWIVLCSVALMSLSCSKKSNSTSDTDGDEAASNLAESAMAEAGQQSTAAEGGSVSLLALEEMSEQVKAADLIDPQDSVRPQAACSLSSSRSTCSSNVSTITWSCEVGTASLSGGWTETWSSGFCANGASPTALTNGNSVTRTSPTGQTLRFASGAKLVTDTVAHSAYNGTSIPGTGVSVSMSGGNRTITINGLRKVLTGPLGRTWFNHSITGSLTVSGTRAGGNRVVTGTSTLYHNIASYTAAHTFNSVTWGSSACCYPTSGSITSTLSGSRTGNTTLSFTATCGVASFTNTDSNVSSVTLSQCN